MSVCFVPEPFPAPPVATEPARAAFENVLKGVGATLPKRDSVDARIIEQIRSGAGRLIDSQNEVGGWPEYRSALPPDDTDGDGMPDEWENAHGFNPVNPADGSEDADSDGYTNIEEYLNGTDPHASD